eukprot:5174967-Pleurochrysis_carterae.AAC.1
MRAGVRFERARSRRPTPSCYRCCCPASLACVRSARVRAVGLRAAPVAGPRARATIPPPLPSPSAPSQHLHYRK